MGTKREKSGEKCLECKCETIMKDNEMIMENKAGSLKQDTDSILSADSEIEIISTSKDAEPTFDFLDNLLNLHLSLNLLDEEDTVCLLYEVNWHKNSFSYLIHLFFIVSVPKA